MNEGRSHEKFAIRKWRGKEGRAECLLWMREEEVKEGKGREGGRGVRVR